MTAIMVTPQLLRDLGACWYDDGADGDAEYRRHVGSLDPVSLADALQLETVPVNDCIWLASRALPDCETRLWACDCAEQALRRIDAPDARSITAIDVARRYARGAATRKELAAAWSAARSAAHDAAWAAAAWAAARSAAHDAAWAAAAWAAAARSAAHDAAWDAERAWQLARALEYARRACQ